MVDLGQIGILPKPTLVAIPDEQVAALLDEPVTCPRCQKPTRKVTVVDALGDALEVFRTHQLWCEACNNVWLHTTNAAALR